MPAVAKNRIAKLLPSKNGHDKEPKRTEVHMDLVRPDIRILELHINGVTPLIVHRQSEKTRKAIEDKQAQKAAGPRQKRDPKQEYLDSFYMMPGSTKPETKNAKYGIPAAGFKKACENTCSGKFVQNITGTFCKRAFFVLDDGGGLVQIKASKPFMRTDSVKIGGFKKTLDYRYRPEFKEWSCTLKIRYNATAISAEQIANIFMFAGLHEGWGELRPGKGYSNGQWEVVNK
jgi:hypothetical protein